MTLKKLSNFLNFKKFLKFLAIVSFDRIDFPVNNLVTLNSVGNSRRTSMRRRQCMAHAQEIKMSKVKRRT